MTQLRDSHLLVVGATGGLGSAICRRLSLEGARLTLAGRKEEKLDALAHELGDSVVGTVSADLALPGAVAAVAAATAREGGLDGVIYAAGVVAFGPLGELDEDAFEKMLLLNFVVPVQLFKSLLPQLKPGSTVVHLSAIVAEKPMKGMAVYSATKSALTSFGAAMASELRRQQIHVLDVRPPHTETGLHTRPISGVPPRLGRGLDPVVVAERIVKAIIAEEADLPSTAFH
ncbi:SDR family NAD(P)-dependent oxidoreductase [Arthrobacter sp. LAPM80]|uniref:SDR family NAD(P)-dependent oxidoreductase n=1 Tax=Arthrobacter sp. LAPM80 TaxID=3141788 RepID=UPI00398A791A